MQGISQLRTPLPEPITPLQIQTILETCPRNAEAPLDRKSELLQILSSLFPASLFLAKVQPYPLEVLQQTLTELQKPRNERRFTEEQIYDRSFQVRPWSPDIELLEVLRFLCNVRGAAATSPS